MSTEQVKAKPLTSEELKVLNELRTRQQTVQIQVSSGLVNQASKHIRTMGDRLDKVNKAKNNDRTTGKAKPNAKHNLCLNLVTNKMPIMESGSFNIQVTVWITSKSATTLSHEQQAKEFYNFLDGKGLGVSFEDFFNAVKDRFTATQV